MYKTTLLPLWWDLVAQGLKTVECRLFKDHHAQVQPNSRFEIKNTRTGEIITGTVVNTTIYPNFGTMLINEGLKHVLPGVNDLLTGIDIYYSIPGYQTGEDIYGVIAIELKVDNH